jgi:carbonic anhydrase
MIKLIPVEVAEDILPEYHNTPIHTLFNYHNLAVPLPPDEKVNRPEMIIGKCMDNRKWLEIPKNYAYILRTPGGNLRGLEFAISYAIGVGGVSTMALISHTDCGMCNVTAKRDLFIAGLMERANFSYNEAERQFNIYADNFEIGDPVEFTIAQAKRLQKIYPTILIAPLLYRVEDERLVQVKEN